MKKERLDLLLVNKGMVESRSKAQRMVMAGQILVNEQMIIKPASKVATNAIIEIKAKDAYVSRGGKKLEWALKYFSLNELKNKVCADVGASTGGFTDCLLQHGAVKVYAIDVGYGILHWKMRNHPDVIVMERTNARYVESLPEKIDLVTVDASFIPLKILFPVIRKWMDDGQAIALIKPQFEAGRKVAAKGKGVIRDPLVHKDILKEVLDQAESFGFEVLGLTRSPIQGPKGNVEFLVHLSTQPTGKLDHDLLISKVLDLEAP
ncbi:MAG: TlyA family RNA methyltransferase [Anaerolineaceae bacterium]|nr:TlyA family RNA methyltransferase [Anaerolineaceae bacterium]